jgi:hypothetical protein
MAIVPRIEATLSFKGKTHTGLVVSEGNAPAEKFMISKDNKAEPFDYNFAPPGSKTVVLAKGKIVEAVGLERDPDNGLLIPSVKQAEEVSPGVASTRVIGVNLHNVYARRRDAMESNAHVNPTVITRNYIDVPLFENADPAAASGLAKAMRYGAAYGVTNGFLPGDYVVGGANGNFRKYDSAKDDRLAIVGQVLGIEKNLPTAGFLQYYAELVNPEFDAIIKAMSVIPSAGRPNSDKDAAYPYGIPYNLQGWKNDFEKLLGIKNPLLQHNGIPFLTDGFFRAQELYTNVAINDVSKIEVVRKNDNGDNPINITGSTVTVPAGMYNGAIYIKIKHKIDTTRLSEIKVKADLDGAGAGGAVALSSNDIHLDLQNNTIVVYLAAGQTYTNMTVDYPAIVNPIAGTPTEYDYKGTVGGIRILLQK